jgi:ribosome-associated protein
VANRDDRPESRRTQVRRERRNAGDQSAELASALMKLPAAAFAKLALDEDVREDIERARKIVAPIARRRAERALAGDLRRQDLDDLAARLADLDAMAIRERRVFEEAERWRTRLIDEGLVAAAEFPGGSAEPLPQLIAQARRERTTGKPPGAARALFRHVATVLKAQSAPAAKPSEEPDADDDDDD